MQKEQRVHNARLVFLRVAILLGCSKLGSETSLQPPARSLCRVRGLFHNQENSRASAPRSLGPPPPPPPPLLPQPPGAAAIGSDRSQKQEHASCQALAPGQRISLKRPTHGQGGGAQPHLTSPLPRVSTDPTNHSPCFPTSVPCTLR